MNKVLQDQVLNNIAFLSDQIDKLDSQALRSLESNMLSITLL